MGFWPIALLVVVVGHFIVGFVFLVIKLSPKKKDKENVSLKDSENEDY